MTTEPLNRAQARWMGRTKRRVLMDSGEMVTARKHPKDPTDAVVVWKDQASVGKQSGALTWWEDAANLTEVQLKEKYDDWNYWGRKDLIEGVNDGR